MCGIAGRASRAPDTRLPGRVVDTLAHRGPDARGTQAWSGPCSSWDLAHTRLSIVDLSAAGNQPMANEDGSLVMVFNGEIYNFADLRRMCEQKGHRFRSDSDGEVILHLWEMEGAEALRRLNGIFAVAVASTSTGTVWLARDPLGVKPLVFCLGDDRELWFASELATLAATDAPIGGHDTVALAQFLSFLWIPDPRTPFRDARTLEPGHVLQWTPDGVTQRPYADLASEAAQGTNAATDADIGVARTRLLAAVERQLLADVPIALMASGGVDSSLVWWAGRDEIDHAYTIDWSADRGTERLREDTDTVRELERRFGTPVDYLEGAWAEIDSLPLSGDLFADPAFDLTRVIARRAHERGHKVLLSGQGGDELFGGYRRHLVAPLLGHVHLGGAGRALAAGLARLAPRSAGVEYLARVARATAERDPLAAYLQLCTYSSAADRASALGCTESEVADEIVWQRHRDVFERLPASSSLARRVRLLDLLVYLPGIGLAQADRAGMEFGVEIRVPWLDLELVRWAMTLPDPALARGHRGKRLTRRLAAVELTPRIARRPKRGFAVPEGRLQLDHGREGTRGFRQGTYFARARAVLERYLGP